MIEVISKFKNSTEERNKIVNISVNKIKPNPYQPRKYFDKLALNELAESIKQYGVIQPISVRKLRSGAYELVAGERRLKASKIANLEEIPCIILEIGDNDSAILALIENLQREDLNFMEEAESYFHLISEHGFTQEELAIKIGKSQSTIANKLRILKLPPLVKKIINDNGLTERHARALLKLPDEQLQLKILKKVCERGLNVKTTEEIIDKTIIDFTSKKEKQEIKHKKIFKDIRIFINTLRQAIAMIKDAGVNANITEKNNNEYIEYIIKIPK